MLACACLWGSSVTGEGTGGSSSIKVRDNRCDWCMPFWGPTLHSGWLRACLCRRAKEGADTNLSRVRSSWT